MNNLFKKLEFNGLPIPAFIFWGASLIMFIRMLMGALPYRSYYNGVGAGFNFMTIMIFLALAGIGVCIFLKMRIGVAGGAALLVLMEFINMIVSFVFVGTNRGSFYYGFAARGFLMVSYWWTRLLAVLCLAAVIILPCFVPKAKKIIDKLFFIPAAVFALAALIGLGSIGRPGVAAVMFFEAMAIAAAMFFLCMWLKKEAPASSERRASRATSANAGPARAAAPQKEVVEAEAKVIINCANCGQALKVPAGKNLQITCPKCGNVFTART